MRVDSQAPQEAEKNTPIDADISQFRQRIEAVLDRYVTDRIADTDVFGAHLIPPMNSLQAFTMAKAKRVRPTFAWLGWRGYGGDPTHSAALQAFAALELIQACALIHDDIIDSSDTRRGCATVHRQFQELHQQQQWAGHSANYGEAIAILLGDIALAWADDMFATAGLSPRQFQAGWQVWQSMRTEVISGQILDISVEVEQSADLEAAMKVNTFKTAAYTVERPLHLGAVLATADGTSINDEQLHYLRSFGRKVGIAFQLRDDDLGVFGDPAVTGKPSGDDLQEGKRTALIAHTLNHATVDQQELVNELLGQDLSEQQVDQLRSIIISTGARTKIENMITTLMSEAEVDLAQTGMNPSTQQSLYVMAQRATQRLR